MPNQTKHGQDLCLGRGRLYIALSDFIRFHRRSHRTGGRAGGVALCDFTRSRRRSVRGKAGAARTARCARAEADAEGWAPAHQANWTYNVRPAIGFSLYSLQNFKLI